MASVTQKGGMNEQGGEGNHRCFKKREFMKGKHKDWWTKKEGFRTNNRD